MVHHAENEGAPHGVVVWLLTSPPRTVKTVHGEEVGFFYAIVSGHGV
jgi:hypothetical protein